ncbi:TPA: hypothetical protein N0F65_004186 [Lagenidium giganteum]|uniref:Uncharacterized protein n=1 Tax=Lagenidium giganteum TaxID=4803 RepID=A0AAV2YKX0_9STRA|nr:TPA: hypothetical protein N0F65_004186 [Lagenidium giganteum]
MGTHALEDDAKTAVHVIDNVRFRPAYQYCVAHRIVSVFECATHWRCDRMLRIKPKSINGLLSYDVEGKGLHGNIQSEIGLTGIAIKRKADDMLNGDSGPVKCVHLLMNALKDEPRLLQYLPSVPQLKNRKQYLRKAAKDGWELKTSFDILEWIYPRLITTKEEYQQAELQESEHACIQLSSDGGTFEFYGVIMTSQFMLRNMVVAIDTQWSDVLAVTDGTYKIHFGIDVVGGWTLIDYGSHIPSYSRRRYRRVFKPWMYMFVHQVYADVLWSNVASSVRQSGSLVHHFSSLPSNLAGHHFAELLSPPSSECSVEEGQAPSSRVL